MIKHIKRHWQFYLMEALGLAGFVIAAGLLTILLEHPDLFIMKSSLGKHAFLRRIPLGIIMGSYTMAVIVLFGKKSGAHINPAVTWAYFRLGKIDFLDAMFFTIAQFCGAVAGAQSLKYVMGDLFSNPAINFGVTKPKPNYSLLTAFVSEFMISFILMLVLLMAGSSKRFEKKVALFAGVLVAAYLIIEIPFSGMSMNPARSFAGAFAANEWPHLWIYFAAPVLAMLAACEVFLVWKKKQTRKYKIMKEHNLTGIDYKEIEDYPIENIKLTIV